MKNQRLFLGFFIIMLILICMSCGKKDDPKILAKETVELTKQLSSNLENAERIQAKLDEIQSRVEKLSLSNQIKYIAEVTRLGAGEIKDVFNSDGMKSSLNELNSALDDLKNLQY